MSELELYEGREQTLVKHYILSKYLERFAHIISSRWDIINYVDCFAGPWNAKSENFEDSSFSIALRELRKARNTYLERGRNVQLRCLFLEKDPKAYEELRRFADGVKDAEIQTRSIELESAVSDIVRFASVRSDRAFTFIFIDPTGWSGFAMSKIAPLLKIEPGEVLINFMIEHIRRFLDSPQHQTQRTFEDLFGLADYRSRLAGLSQQERDDEAVALYSENVRRVGNFPHVSTAVVLHPEIDRKYFYLIYGTRNPKGIEVFKQAEKSAMCLMEEARADAQTRKRERATGQMELRMRNELGTVGEYYKGLRNHYLTKSKAVLHEILRKGRRVLYDDAWAKALSFPLVWDSDLKCWISGWREDSLSIEGMSKGQRVPRLRGNNVLVWQKAGQ